MLPSELRRRLAPASVPACVRRRVRGGRSAQHSSARRSSTSIRAGIAAAKEPASREFVDRLQFIRYDDVPLYRVMDQHGKLSGANHPTVSEEKAVYMHETMVKVNGSIASFTHPAHLRQ